MADGQPRFVGSVGKRGFQQGLGRADLTFRSKGALALDMIHRLRQAGLHFAYTVFDAGYGQTMMGETFLAEVHANQMIYLADPAPAVPPRRSLKGKAPRRLQGQEAPLTVTAWVAAQAASCWRQAGGARGGER